MLLRALGTLALLSCIGELDYQGKACPCPAGWFCREGTCAREPSGSGTGAAGGHGGAATSGSAGGGSRCDYAGVVLGDAPIAYWRLGESAGSVANDSGPNGYTGTYQGGVELALPGALAGDGDTAARFDGIDSVLEVDDASAGDFSPREAFSVEAWMRREDPANEGAVMGRVAFNGGYVGVLVALNNQGNLRVSRGDGSVNNLVLAPPPPVGAWGHVVGTYDGSELRLYVNAELEGAVASTVDIPVVAEPFKIGHFMGWARFKGSLDEVAIYDHALSATEVLAHYQAGICP